MRLSEIQRRRSLPEEAQQVPFRRTVAWSLIAAGIAVGVYLFFRYAHTVTPLLTDISQP